VTGGSFPGGGVWGLLALLLSVGVVQPARCQTGGPGLSLGLEARRLRQSDELVSPLRYSGTAWGPTLAYGFSSPVQRGGFTLALGLPTLTSSQTKKGAHKQEGYRLDLSGGLFRRVMGSETGSSTGGSNTGMDPNMTTSAPPRTIIWNLREASVFWGRSPSSPIGGPSAPPRVSFWPCGLRRTSR
jgi:hypothetical protein